MVKNTCKICGECITSKNWRGFSTHLKKHKITYREYKEKFPKTYEEPTGEYGVDYVLCPICNNNRQFQSLTQHIINKHNLSTEQFLVKYPKHKLFTTKYSEMRANYCRKGSIKNWSSEEYRKKRSEYCSKFFSELNSGAKRPAQSKNLTKTLNRLWTDPEYRKKQSDKCKAQHESGELTKAIVNGFRSNWIKYTTVYETVITLKSSYELEVVKFFEKFNIDYEYEKVYDYYDTERKKYRKYYADFYLPSYDMVLEVKASWATDKTNNRDKMLGVVKTGTKFKFITERELEKLVSMEDFETMIQSKVNE